MNRPTQFQRSTFTLISGYVWTTLFVSSCFFSPASSAIVIFFYMSDKQRNIYIFEPSLAFFSKLFCFTILCFHV